MNVAKCSTRVINIKGQVPCVTHAVMAWALS
ncbi:Uncharacterised protein [Vibrio cholerae]|nr:Uncharacterised protein [Vibrio cholerae]CSD34584.1 Uncharacterised protein [Vibrio cholerae]